MASYAIRGRCRRWLDLFGVKEPSLSPKKKPSQIAENPMIAPVTRRTPALLSVFESAGGRTLPVSASRSINWFIPLGKAKRFFVEYRIWPSGQDHRVAGLIGASISEPLPTSMPSLDMSRPVLRFAISSTANNHVVVRRNDSFCSTPQASV